MICDDEIREITQVEADAIIDTRQPLGLFYTRENEMFVGIDNSTGDAWTENFKTLTVCMKWLRGL